MRVIVFGATGMVGQAYCKPACSTRLLSRCW
ncbi:hypothetical protein RERY_42300 [Rhodococcus erythropolis]|nr:hypothetical protein RERY_42300 [Rhodococcus erythropolis]